MGDVARSKAAELAHETALVSGSANISFAGVNDRMNRLTNAMGRLGLRKGDRVALLSKNRAEFLEVCGVAKAGLVAVPLNWRLAPRELLNQLLDCEPAVVIAEPGFVPTIDGIRNQLASVRAYLIFGQGQDGWHSYSELLEAAPSTEPDVEVSADDVICLMYTSGTTGRPKGVMLTHRGILNNCRIAQSIMKFGRRDVVAAVMPLFHVGGFWYHFFPSFAAGCTTVILADFSPSALIEICQAHSVTNTHLVPTMLRAVVDEIASTAVDPPRLKTILYAASSIPSDLLVRALDVFQGCSFVQCYGSTEAGVVTALMPGDHLRAASEASSRRLLLSCGRPVDDTLVAIRDAADLPVRPGEIGEILVSSPNIMAGYWNNPTATRQAVGDGWLRTGDLGTIDDDGYLYVADRKHDMIVTGGENVYPREVEDVLFQDPNIAEVAVFGLPDPKWVQRVAAAVVLTQGCHTTADEIRGRAMTRLASYKCPKTIIFVANLPKNAAGKVLKRELRQEFAAVTGEAAPTS